MAIMLDDLSSSLDAAQTSDFFKNSEEQLASAANFIASDAPEMVAPESKLNRALEALAAKPIPAAFEVLGLSPELLRAVADLGFTEPTPVQSRVIPLAIPDIAAGAAQDVDAYVDLMVSSQTGSGKTAAFLLPVLHQVQAMERAAHEAEIAAFKAAQAKAIEEGTAPPKRPKRGNPMDPRNFKPCRPLALVLTPTRELAQQVAHDAVDLVRPMKGCRVATVMGGTPYGIQIQRLQNASIVVATPGRLLDLQRNGQIQLEAVQFLVVDEADRMLDLGFADDLAEIHSLTAARRQTMMFSATFAPRIMVLGERVMRRPQRIEVNNAQQRHDNIKQSLYWADDDKHQRALLDHFLRDTAIEQAIVFSGTQDECDVLATELADAGFSAAALHGAMPQSIRNRRLQALRNQQIQILVATDVAARGIDVPSISHVINHGLPMKAEDYTHRIGRTGRAGRDGIAITIAPQRSRRRVADIEAFTRQAFDVAIVPGLEPKIRPPAPKWGNKPGKGGKPASHRGDRFEGNRFSNQRDGASRAPRGHQEKQGFGRSFGFGAGTNEHTRNEQPASFRQRDDRGAFDRQVFERASGEGFASQRSAAPKQAASDWADRAARAPMDRLDQRRSASQTRSDYRHDGRGESKSFAPRHDGQATTRGFAPRSDAFRPAPERDFRAPSTERGLRSAAPGGGFAKNGFEHRGFEGRGKAFAARPSTKKPAFKR